METGTAILVFIAALGCGFALGIGVVGELRSHTRACLLAMSIGTLLWLSFVTFGVLNLPHRWLLN
jgi:hypothetical protein